MASSWASSPTLMDGVTAGRHGEEHLRGADVGGGLLAPDVLLAGLQCEPEGRHAVSVLRQADHPAGQLAFQSRAHGDVTGVRAAVEQRHAEPLCRADGDVHSPVGGRPDQGERQQVAGRDQLGTVVMGQSRELAEVGRARQHPIRAGHLRDDRERLVRADGVGEAAGGDHHLDTAGQAPGAQHGEALRQDRRIDHDAPTLA